MSDHMVPSRLSEKCSTRYSTSWKHIPMQRQSSRRQFPKVQHKNCSTLNELGGWMPSTPLLPSLQPKPTKLNQTFSHQRSSHNTKQETSKHMHPNALTLKPEVPLMRLGRMTAVVRCRGALASAGFRDLFIVGACWHQVTGDFGAGFMVC